MKWLLLLAVLLSCYCSCLHAQTPTLSACSFTDQAKGKVYDLTELALQFRNKASESQDDTTPPGYHYYVTPCQQVKGVSGCGAANMGVCQLTSNKVFYNVGGMDGAVTSALDGGREGFRVSFEPMLGKQSTLDYVCDKSAGVGSLKWVTVAKPFAPYLWTFEWRSMYACPVGGGGGGGGGGGDDSNAGGLAIGWILIVCVASVAVVYLAVGVVVQKFVFKEEGVRLIPNSDLWLALPGLVKDGHVYVFTKTVGLFRRGGSYQDV